MRRLLLLIAGVLMGWNGQAQFVILYESTNFRGEHLLIDREWSCNEQSSFCSEIESIEIPDGWEVWAYEDKDFSGEVLRLNRSWNGTDGEAWKWRNDIGSIRIVRQTIGQNYSDLGVALFQRKGLKGEHIFISKNWSCDQNRSFCSDIESIYVPPGWEVWAYEDRNYRGEVMRLTKSWYGTDGNAWQWVNDIGSVRIVRKFRTTPYGPKFKVEQGIALFKSPGFKGEHVFTRNDWSCQNSPGFCNDVESIFVPKGWEIMVYEHRNFRGEHKRLNASWNGNGPNNWQWRNDIGSIRILKKPLGRQARHLSQRKVVSLFEHNFEGRKMVISKDWTVLGSNDPFNDRISSIHVPKGWKVIVYEHAHFRGNSMEITGQWQAERSNSFWNDRISSIRVVRLE